MIECQAIQVDCFGGLANVSLHQYKVIGCKMIALAKFNLIVSFPVIFCLDRIWICTASVF